jgi:hypothetical protein
MKKKSIFSSLLGMTYLISLAAAQVGKDLENIADVRTPILQILLHSSG